MPHLRLLRRLSATVLCFLLAGLGGAQAETMQIPPSWSDHAQTRALEELLYQATQSEDGRKLSAASTQIMAQDKPVMEFLSTADKETLKPYSLRMGPCELAGMLIRMLIFTTYQDAKAGQHRLTAPLPANLTAMFAEHMNRCELLHRNVPSTLRLIGSSPDQAAIDQALDTRRDAPAMRKALARVAETLPDFLALAANPKEGTSDYALKVAIPDGRKTEYFWVIDFSEKDGTFSGTLNNKPRFSKKYKFGDRITFQRAQIVDWIYNDARNKRRTFGHFTTCAALAQEPPDQAALVMEIHHLACEP